MKEKKSEIIGNATEKKSVYHSGCSSWAEHMPCIHDDLGSFPKMAL